MPENLLWNWILELSEDIEAHPLPHRALAAFFAIDFRLAADSFSARAFPPFCPPSRPRATAWGFFPAFGSSSGVPSSFSPMARSTTWRATVAKS